MANGRNCGTAKCAHCGNEFRKPSNGAKYCSKQCADDALREARKIRRRKYNEVQMAPRVCPTCGNTFKPHKVKQMYCCGYCAVKAKRAAMIAARTVEKTCPQCGEKFKTSRSDRMFCSDTCCKRFLSAKNYRETHPVKTRRKGSAKKTKAANATVVEASASIVIGCSRLTEAQRAQVLSDMKLSPAKRFERSSLWTPSMHSYAKSVWKTRYDRCSSFAT